MLQIIPMSIGDAREYIAQHHRHHRPPVSGLFAVGVAEGNTVCGVAVVGRPVARGIDDGWTAEVTRVATDGARNACSMLYGACWRAARALGYRTLNCTACELTGVIMTICYTKLAAEEAREPAFNDRAEALG